MLAFSSTVCLPSCSWRRSPGIERERSFASREARSPASRAISETSETSWRHTTQLSRPPRGKRLRREGRIWRSRRGSLRFSVPSTSSSPSLRFEATRFGSASSIHQKCRSADARSSRQFSLPRPKPHHLSKSFLHHATPADPTAWEVQQFSAVSIWPA